MKPWHQRFVDVGAIGDGEDREAAIFPGSPQHILDFNAGMAVVAVFHISAFAKKSIRFVEKQNHPIIFAPDPFRLGFTVLFSGFLGFSHLD